ncbi:MAG TPA: alpha-galactosidase [Clostridium sp.]|nr:alpha-galactosidase [Clostridium sp.]
MSIKYFEKNRVFKLDANNTTYMIAIVDKENFVGHVYYGKKVIDNNLNYLLRLNEPPFVPSKNNRDRVSFYDSFSFEYPTHGIGDFRETAFEVKDPNGNTACKLQYVSHEIYKGKKRLENLPSTFGNEDECTTLELKCVDNDLNLEVTLIYTVFENLDAITRSVKVKNKNYERIKLTKVLSMSIDFDGIDYDMISLHGSWARERHINRRKVTYGTQTVASLRGETSHQDSPFIAFLDHDANDEYGEVFGFNFVYSGNFISMVQGCQFDTTRVLMGINPSDFEWILEEGEEFITPEVVMVHSNKGIGQMTRTFHDLYRNHLIRGKFKDKKRPILINNWEATYFDFNTEKLLDIVKEASKCGIEMLVMDDGWFGHRNSDNSSLGDWFVNEEKLKGGLKYLVDEVNKLGLEFGIWIEPEMISPDSELYKKHPDWCIHIEGRTPALCREQYVLDLTRGEVVDYIYNSIKKILKSANITYIKWDMNRQITDLGSCYIDKEHHGEIFHRYVLAVYEMMNRLTTDFPNILLENCSGGGARFDPAMLYYSPQIWCSDDTDSIERLKIQEGTAMVYPLSTMGAHVSDCPNHTVGRTTPFETRGNVALAGTFGYELDITKISEEDRNMISKQVAMYHKYNDLIRRGDYYRIANYSENHEFDCWGVISKDKSEALITCVQVLGRPNYHSRRIRLKGLDENSFYKDEETSKVYSGGALMNAGINISGLYGDFTSKIMHFNKVED